MMKTMDIHSRLYDYSVEFISDLSAVLNAAGPEIAWIIDKNVYQFYPRLFSCVDREKLWLMDAVESNKNMDTVLEVISFWRSIGVKKNWKVYCFGGGITQDIATIASNLYLRNIEWHFFPTTLLAMVDSCIGGKCGINLGGYKNQIGVFYPPHRIYIDVRFLDTLQRQDYLNGWGEILKFSLTLSPDFYEELKLLKQFIPCEGIERYIYRGLAVKKQIIEEDEFESDLRRILNYGHTFGHALEAYTDNAVPHGEGVIWGMDVVNYLAYREGLIEYSFYADVRGLIRRAFLPQEMVIEQPEVLFDIIKTDKKVRGNTLSFAMPDRPGHLIVYPMAIDERLKKLFLEYLEETHDYYSN